jgi:hypothetical protein
MVCNRVRYLLWRAPFSLFDFIMSLCILFMGMHMLIAFDLFAQFGGIYARMNAVMSQPKWAVIFILCGAYSLFIVLWPRRPIFVLRLLARMALAFCLIAFALNAMLHHPPPASGTLVLILALFSLWSIVRTRCDGPA